MSGPKVVRIVTREEIIELCEGLLARLDAAVNRWIDTGTRNEAIAESDIENLRSRVRQMRGMLERDEFMALQKQVPDEIAFLSSDMSARLKKVKERKARARTNRRRQAAGNRAMVSALKSGGVDVPAEPLERLEQAASDKITDTETSALLAEALSHLPAETTGPQTTERQRELAATLAGSEQGDTIAQWQVRQATADTDPRLAHADTMIEELAALGFTTESETLAARSARLVDEPGAPQAALRIDSLIADLSAACVAAEHALAQRARLEECHAELARIESQGASDLAAAIVTAVTATENLTSHGAVAADQVDNLVTQANRFVFDHREAIAAEARRRAILEGLSSLGYELREGMSVAFASGESIVMPNTSTPGFGLEVASAGTQEQMQVRVVAFGTDGVPRDTSRDADIETMWCGDLAKLRERLAASGSTVSIEMARDAGAVPLKIVEAETAGIYYDETQHPTAGTRTMT